MQPIRMICCFTFSWPLTRMLRLSLCILLLLINSFALADSIDELIVKRLGHMKDVALYKSHHHLPIEDREREKVVIDNAVRRGLRLGLKPESSRRFFEVQIAAAKEIQAYWFAQWQSHPERRSEKIPDLINDIRPALIRLGDEIIEKIAQEDTRSLAIQPVEGLSAETKTQLESMLPKIQQYNNRLSQIVETGKLRVGTTGDYEPFSLKSGDEYRGIDIDLGKNLASSLNVEIVWVATSWPTLMQDLKSGAFDIGMSGISRSLKRQKTGFFSTSYHAGGKTPIIRCADKRNFNSLGSIDQQGVRLIVNPGGTNQQYVRNNISQASLKIHDDNRTIFTEISEGRADVMITDDIEVQLQIAKDRNLCAAMPGTNLTFSQKGYLLPQDIVLKEYVDHWLTQRIGDGTVAEIFRNHLSAR